jgi:hypothetical protein
MPSELVVESFAHNTNAMKIFSSLDQRSPFAKGVAACIPAIRQGMEIVQLSSIFPAPYWAPFGVS